MIGLMIAGWAIAGAACTIVYLVGYSFGRAAGLREGRRVPLHQLLPFSPPIGDEAARLAVEGEEQPEHWPFKPWMGS